MSYNSILILQALTNKYRLVLANIYIQGNRE